VFEQRIFRNDPLLSPWCLCGAEAFWKLTLLLLFGPFYKYVRVSTQISNSGTLENFGEAVKDLCSNEMLLYLALVNAALVGLSHVFGYAIIKYEDAVLQTTITLTIILTTWLFFLCWPNIGHEEFNFFTLLGMALLAGGSYMYVQADLKSNEKRHTKLEVSIDILDEEEPQVSSAESLGTE
jgi:hypothetical protein